MSDSNIFVQNRVLGYVSNEVPLKIRYIKRRKENLIVTCVDKAFYTWSSSRFSLLSVSPLHEHSIHCLAADNFLVFSASGNKIQAWRRGVELKQTYTTNSETSIHLILPFGPHLIGVDDANILTIWDIKTEDIYLELNFAPESFRITAICHPHTYINKILLGSEQGLMQLWNVCSSTLVYSFAGWNSTITVITQSPALDIVGIGLQNGKILLHNLKFDETLITFMQDWGPVTALTFRTDGQPVMASASTLGHIVFWNLEERKVMSQLLHAHNAAVSGMEYLPNEPLLVTSSSDNSLKMWIFDRPDGGARLLRIREGHSVPPTFIRFYGVAGEHILSTGPDGYLRAFNTTTEIANKNLGRAVYLDNGRKTAIKTKTHDLVDDSDYCSKMPPIVQFSSQTTREKEWANIAAIHRDTPIVSTWSFGKCKFNSILLSKQFKQKVKLMNAFKTYRATSVFVTHCGNFVLVGYNNGEVEKFNIQSGLYRGSYGNPRAHDGCVTGVTSNSVNQVIITGSTDQHIKFWSFRQHNRKYLSQIDVEDSISFFICHAETSILAVALENYTIFVVDIDCRTIIRKFSGHSAQITDCTFSPDCRWLVSVSMDSTLQIWDIPTSQRTDLMHLGKPSVSVTFCPTGMYMATAHVNQLGITLWLNRSVFTYLSLNLNRTLELNSENNIDEISTRYSLITLATNAENCSIAKRWQTLLQIDLIRQRNASKEVKKDQEQAPFILPIVPALNMKFDLSANENEKTKPSQRIINIKPINTRLKSIKKLENLSPSLINFEIASLSPENGGSIDLMLQFLDMLNTMFQSKQHFELSSSYLALFLKNHATFIIDNPKLYNNLEILFNMHKENWSKLQEQFLYCISVSKFLREN